MMHTFREGLPAGSVHQSYVGMVHSHSEIDDSLQQYFY
jgi:hypothetical protein